SRFFSSVKSLSAVSRRLKEYSPSTKPPTESIHSVHPPSVRESRRTHTQD
ncbi:hypothetical protein LINPERHAP2_LOCUS35578, partial [Linum perenne]